jgi:hypothetical protein
VERIIQKFGNSGDPFYQSFRPNLFGYTGGCIEAKILLPLKVLAYGVAPHCFIDYFQMSISQAGRCCRQFNLLKVPLLFGEEYNRCPDAMDLQAITALHKRVHGVEGMLGSLDCMHTYWKNCPVAWQQSFHGKESSPTIVLEACADYNLWFWHQSYGYAGALNDLNILNLSPLLARMTDGRFQAVERESKVVPFNIGQPSTQSVPFDRVYLLVDGIYPKYSRFVRGFKAPTYDDEIRFTAWQEGARKDIERAFGVLQCKWKAIAFPIHSMDLGSISKLMGTCLILHNMAVSDRVMGDVNRRYVPSTVAEKESPVEVFPTDWQPTPSQGRWRQRTGATAISNFDDRLAANIAERTEWKILRDPVEWARLQRALIDLKGKEKDQEEDEHN